MLVMRYKFIEVFKFLLFDIEIWGVEFLFDFFFRLGDGGCGGEV